ECDQDPLDPVYLPAALELLDAPEHFRVQQVGRYPPANSSLGSRSETFLLLQPWPRAQPLLRASYPPFATQQVVPPRVTEPQQRPVPWDVRAVSVEVAVTPAEPHARVLFHLKGQDWPPGPGSLPCARLHATHPAGTAHQACRFQEDPGEQALPVGDVELRPADPPQYQEVPLDEAVTLRVPDMPVRPGQLFSAALLLQHNFTASVLTLRIKVKKGLHVKAARPAQPALWTAKLDRFKGSKHHTTLITCHRDRPAGPDSSSPLELSEFLWVDFLVENGTSGGVAVTRPVTWQLEYPGQAPEAEKDKMVWEILVSERDIRALVPLAKAEELVNTAPLTGVPRHVPVRLVTVDSGGALVEVTEHIGCESANTQVLQVSEACDAVFVAGKESRGAQGVQVDFWWRRLRASLRLTVWAPLLPLRIELTDTTLEQVRGWREVALSLWLSFSDHTLAPAELYNHRDLGLSVSAEEPGAVLPAYERGAQLGVVRVTELELGMYALLGIFCLAILIFLVNGVVFMLRYQRKEPPDGAADPASPQPHNWVWLGTDQEDLSRQLDRQSPGLPKGEGGCPCESGGGGEALTLAQAPAGGTTSSSSTLARKEAGGRRKRDIRWVCEDMGLKDPEELRSYMERIRGSS
ncbi:hypothetical protein E2I00_018321, partial [Balaenoptera physalus]